ncbi:MULTISPECIES: Nif11 family protein [Prochlorococcus]|uniref:Nif11 domain-containing protein n=1 Tax=Prochlorococcus marinus (strain SARG / CCMP1375 / SS120) TaxID=167539 RepID=Q7VB09_PROMA|nr:MULTISPECIES: Nif11 family protein [Prochlorococcus]AAQ00336.1 Predicted protein [Prochlorococcus marinus subsp. marinus str. CCMP1375]KGG14215.1 hypothetical protein EV04_0066 [Prochlorococcus marinus str. LG]KGG22213.1 hypothetical protein EV08_0389 [Prochlorococcus marinus str. SS2]KGG24470.1 hypothetical protein EV09_0100 [Prochlorococcus marinus str. SS35]KGG33365.1 hypothetical protein EV10_0572 [Prochlorococcus marinus str. SS51]
MSKKDLSQFLEKIDNLNQLVGSLDEVPGRRERLASCERHEQVVELAKSWGFEIGRRWGE